MANSRRKCSYCKRYFKPVKTFPGPSAWCSPECASSLALERLLPRKRREERRKAKAETRQQREALKTKPQLIREAQRAFNEFIRLRDRGLPCISCGQLQQERFTGGHFDCGHYRSTGASPENRFNEDNSNAQCKRCNRDLSGNIVEYRRGLIDRIGLDRVEALEAANEPARWSKDDLRAIRDKYREKCKDIRKRINA